ncbi:hypothetical protein [Massilia aquatica]|uniref:MFS transporter n=1 Tax=Massilia aquatica TaxID=2609000 RepID=A0ABX0LYS1_9BURK|nr:hypothetical protein [Massilia aquatica]NHZ39702.1 hypothetical protein [Massilia aquatica]
MWGSFGLILPVLTLLLVHEVFSLFEIGMFAALFSLPTVILVLPFGALAGRLGGIRAYRRSLLTNCAGCGIMLLGEQKPLLFIAAGSCRISMRAAALFIDRIRQAVNAGAASRQARPEALGVSL